MTATLPKLPRFRSEAEVFNELFDFSPFGFEAGDTNLSRYVGNSPTNLTDPTGLSPWEGIATILGKKWAKETCERAAESLAKELLEKISKYRPDEQKAQEIIKNLKAMGWVETTMLKGEHAGQGMILWEMVDGKKTGRMLEWHPGGGHHGPNPHWKFSSAESGTWRARGGVIFGLGLAFIPGAAQACEGDYNGAGRDVAWSATPGSWFSDSIAAYFTRLFDWTRSDHDARMEEYHGRATNPLDRIPNR